MGILLHLITATLAVAISAYLLPGVSIASPITALVAAVVLGILNALLRPLLLLLTLPVNILTLGLFTFVINAFVVMLASQIVPGFVVASFGWALLFSLILSVVSWFFAGRK
ncbi:phage holin family protein [Candidatus Gracilibacteria bacterium]|nr:phage holin family protein [Candidatus Gracilibacteria bacterium]